MQEYGKQIIEEIRAKSEARKDFYCNIKDDRKPKYYALAMLPYPSGNAHVGHARVYTIADTIARFKKLKGYNVINPMGWDSFGLPAENAAISNKADPAVWTKKNIELMKEQLLAKAGFSFDWTKEINSCEPEYYKWSQWIFLQFLKHGKAFRDKTMLNWCPKDETVLAEEQVIDGCCWRDGTPVEKRLMEQWFLKLTDYSERLWNDISKLKNWAGEALAVQKNWINQSVGANIRFEVAELEDSIEVYTTRADTLFGVTAIVIAPENPITKKMLQKSPDPKLIDYINESKQKNTLERVQNTEKTGIITGWKAICPLSGRDMDVFVADYVLGDYATGAVMCVPAHDERDFIFAKKFALDVLPVIKSTDDKEHDYNQSAYTEDGILVNSKEFNGLTSNEAKEKIIAKLESKNKGSKQVVYNLRDWSVGRQRYWGCPIPVIYCDCCGVVPAPEDQLPVLLPTNVSFENGKANIKEHKEFTDVKCPKCGKDAQRETDTLDTFICSSWYAFRYLDPQNNDKIFDSKAINKFMPIDFYVGGLEHAAQHMLYFRFFTKFFKDIGLIDFDEPVDHFFCNGMVLKDGAKMSKSKGNVVVPSDIIEEYGPDALRIYILSDSPADQELDWTDAGIIAKYNFIKRNFRNITEYLSNNIQHYNKDVSVNDFSKRRILNEFYLALNEIESNMEKFGFNTSIASLHKMSNSLGEAIKDTKDLSDKDHAMLINVIKDFLIVSGIFMPFFSEWIYDQYFEKNTSIYNMEWPNFDKSILETDDMVIAIQINGKKCDVITLPKSATEKDIEALIAGNNLIQNRLNGKEIVKRIYVPGKIYNIAVK